MFNYFLPFGLACSFFSAQSSNQKAPSSVLLLQSSLHPDTGKLLQCLPANTSPPTQRSTPLPKMKSTASTFYLSLWNYPKCTLKRCPFRLCRKIPKDTCCSLSLCLKYWSLQCSSFFIDFWAPSFVHRHKCNASNSRQFFSIWSAWRKWPNSEWCERYSFEVFIFLEISRKEKLYKIGESIEVAFSKIGDFGVNFEDKLLIWMKKKIYFWCLWVKETESLKGTQCTWASIQ